ncbi:MAG: hypothetical protein DSZ13_00220, partial [Candidatus Thioglobus sp.]
FVPVGNGNYGSLTFVSEIVDINSINQVIGTWTYTLDNNNLTTSALTAGEQVADTITIKIDDNNGSDVTQDIVINITGVNDAPVATNDTATTDEDILVNINVLDNDTDIEGDTLTVTQATAANGTVTINADGTLAYTGNKDFNGTDTITYTLSDGALTDTETVEVTLDPVNDAATITGNGIDNPINLDEANVALTTSGVLTSVDIDNLDTFTASTNVGTYGTLNLTENGLWDYEANSAHDNLAKGVTATDEFTVASIDGTEAVITITITGTNDAPVIDSTVEQTGALTEDHAIATATGMVIATDADMGDSLTYSVNNTQGTYGSISLDTQTGQWTYTIDNTAGSATQALAKAEQATDNFSVTVTDGEDSTSQEIVISITGTNDAPIATTDNVTTNEDTSVIIDVLANDSDVDGDDLTVTSATANNGTVSINADGTLGYQGKQDFNGTDTITYTVDDGKGGTDTATVTVDIAAVNDAPTIVSGISSVSMSETESNIYDLSAHFSDVEGDTLTYNGTIVNDVGDYISDLPSSWLNLDSATGVITSKPGITNSGDYNIKITAKEANTAETHEVTTSYVLSVENAIVSVASHGTLSNAQAFLDANDNGALDWIDANGDNKWDAGEGESWTLTGDDGGFVLIGISQDEMDNGKVVIQSYTDENSNVLTRDLISGSSVEDIVLTSSTSATVVTPLTTLIEAGAGNSDQVLAAFGLNENTGDLNSFNPFADGVNQDDAVAFEKAASQIFTAVNAVSQSIVAANDGSGASAFSDTLSQLAAKISDAGSIDLSDGTPNGDLSALYNSAVESAGLASDDRLNKYSASITKAISNINNQINDIESFDESAKGTLSLGADELSKQVTDAVKNDIAITLAADKLITLTENDTHEFGIDELNGTSGSTHVIVTQEENLETGVEEVTIALSSYGGYASLDFNQITNKFEYSLNNADALENIRTISETLIIKSSYTNAGVPTTLYTELTAFIVGLNDNPIIESKNIIGDIVEDDVNNTVIGQITVNDIDGFHAESLSIDTISFVPVGNGNYGSLTFVSEIVDINSINQVIGTWTYTLDNNNLTTSALTAGE